MDMYVVKTLALTTVLLVVIYIFTFRRIRKNRDKKWDSVQDYRDRYVKRREHHSGETNYVTKYNSTEDYREK
ncbi:MAG: hypothetical protein IKS16_05510 [Lachnospiraceae bacterium]|nr:hypothetical protein [Lachnospiraceae bacterium]